MKKFEWNQHRGEWTLFKDGETAAIVSKRGDYSNEYTAHVGSVIMGVFQEEGTPSKAIRAAEFYLGIMEALEGKDWANTDVEIEGPDGCIFIIIPPGREYAPDDETIDDISKGWTICTDGSGHFTEYGTLAELVEREAEQLEWQRIVWPKK